MSASPTSRNIVPTTPLARWMNGLFNEAVRP